MMERLAANSGNIPLTMEHLESFAKDGLRTLCLAYRVLSNEEYNVNFKKINEINSRDFVYFLLGMVSTIS